MPIPCALRIRRCRGFELDARDFGESSYARLTDPDFMQRVQTLIFFT